MAQHINIEWTEAAEAEMSMESYSVGFPRYGGPNLEETGKRSRMTWTGPATDMLGKMQDIHSMGSSTEIAGAVTATGEIRGLDNCAAVYQWCRIGGQYMRGLAATWESLGVAIVAAMEPESASAEGGPVVVTLSGLETCPLVYLEAAAVGADGNNIRLEVLDASKGLLVSGGTLSGGEVSEGSTAVARWALGEASAAGTVTIGVHHLELPAGGGAPAQKAVGSIYLSGWNCDTEDLVVEVAGVEVHGGGIGIVAAINARALGVHAQAVPNTEQIELMADVAGAWGNDIGIRAEYQGGDGSKYAVASGEWLSGGADEGERPALAAHGWIGASGDAGLDWADSGTLAINGIVIEREENEALYQALNRYTLSGELGNAGVIAEPSLLDGEGHYRMYLHAALPGAAGNNIAVSWTMTGAYEGMEEASELTGGRDSEAAPARTRADVVEALEDALGEVVAVRVPVVDAAAAGSITVGVETCSVSEQRGEKATGWLRNSGRPDQDIGLYINGVHIVGADPYGGDLPRVWAEQINAANCGVDARMDEQDDSLILLEATEPGEAGNAITLEVGEEYSLTYMRSGATLCGGWDARDMEGLANELGWTLADQVDISVDGSALVLRGRGAALAVEAEGAAFSEVSGVTAGREVHVREESGELVVESVEASSGANVIGYTVGAGCFGSEACSGYLSGGEDAVERKASGWVRLPHGVDVDTGLKVGGERVWLGSTTGTAATLAAAINALGVGVHASVRSARDWVIHLQSRTPGAAGNVPKVSLLGGDGGGMTSGMSGGVDALYQVDYSTAAAAPGGLTLQPYPNSRKAGYCWHISSRITRQEGNIATLETEWAETFYHYDEEDDDEEKAEREQEEEAAETLGEDEDNAETFVDVTAVLEPILTHPAALSFSEANMIAVHAYMNGANMWDTVLVNGKEKKIKDVWPKGWLADLIRKHVFEYYVPHTVVRKQWTGRGNLHPVCQIGHTSGLPSTPADRNWMCMGSGKEKRRDGFMRDSVTKTETWELSSPGGWNSKLYSGQS